MGLRGPKSPPKAIDRAVELIFENQPLADVARTLSEEFNVHVTTGYDWCRKAFTKIGDSDKKIQPFRRLQARQRLEMVFYKCVDLEKFSDALRAQDQLNKIDGIYAAAEVKIDVRQIDTMTQAQKRERVQELLVEREKLLLNEHGPVH